MTCPIHGEFKGFQCKPCFESRYQQKMLEGFLDNPQATFKTILRSDKKHAVIEGWGKKTLCGKSLNSVLDAGVSQLRAELSREVTCLECLKVGSAGTVKSAESDK